MYIVTKTFKTNMKIYFFRKTRNGKLIICNEKLYLFPSKLTEMHIATKTNETNSKNKSFKKARCGRNGKL